MGEENMITVSLCRAFHGLSNWILRSFKRRSGRARRKKTVPEGERAPTPPPVEITPAALKRDFQQVCRVRRKQHFKNCSFAQTGLKPQGTSALPVVPDQLAARDAEQENHGNLHAAIFFLVWVTASTIKGKKTNREQNKSGLKTAAPTSQEKE